MAAAAAAVAPPTMKKNNIKSAYSHLGLVYIWRPYIQKRSKTLTNKSDQMCGRKGEEERKEDRREKKKKEEGKREFQRE